MFASNRNPGPMKAVSPRPWRPPLIPSGGHWGDHFAAPLSLSPVLSMFARLAFAVLIAPALFQLSSAWAEELKRLPGFAETEPVVQLESFNDEPGFFRR